MRDSNRPHRKSESGVAGLIAAALAIALLAMASLVVDGGLALKARSELDNAMDAAVLAGAMELPDTAQATALAQQFLDANQSTVGLLGTPTVTFSFPGSDSDLIQATGTIPVTTLLTGVMGIDNISVGSTSTAQLVDPDLALLFDRSASMCFESHGFQFVCPDDGKPWQLFKKVQNAAKLFIDKMPLGSRVALVSYSTSATLDLALSSDKDLLKSTIDGLVPDGWTDITGAMGTGITELVNNGITGRAPVIVLLTDGRASSVNGVLTLPGPSANDPALAEAQVAADAGVILFSIAFGPAPDAAFLTQMAETTDGGEFFDAPNAGALIQAFLTIADLTYVRLVDVG